MNTFGESTGLYFYSAVFQGNMALLALVGVFAIFRYQQFEMQLRILDDNIKSFVRWYSGKLGFGDDLSLNYCSVTEFPAEIKRLLETPTACNPEARKCITDLIKEKRYIALQSRRTIVMTDSEILIRRFWTPIITTLIVVLASLVMLPLTCSIHSVDHCWEVRLIAITIVANLISLFFVIRFLFVTLPSSKTHKTTL